MWKPTQIQRHKHLSELCREVANERRLSDHILLAPSFVIFDMDHKAVPIPLEQCGVSHPHGSISRIQDNRIQKT